MKGMAGLTRHAEFDAFLSLVLWEDKNGVSLSVLSLLARQNLDPWETALRFMGMPAKAAARVLADMIARQALLAGLSIDAEIAGERAVDLLAQTPVVASVTQSRWLSLCRFLDRLFTSLGFSRRNEP